VPAITVRGFLRIAATGFLVALSASCATVAPDARSPARGLPPYVGRAVALFDDAIDPQAVGYGLESTLPPAGVSLVRERTRVGDCVLRVRVVTITSRREDAGPSWRIGVHTMERLAGDRPPAADFNLQVDSSGPGAGILRTFDSRLIGVTLVAFLREFVGTDESAGGKLHFHLAREGTEELQAVRIAALLGEVQ
jgi:hypothetical protein